MSKKKQIHLILPPWIFLDSLPLFLMAQKKKREERERERERGGGYVFNYFVC